MRSAGMGSGVSKSRLASAMLEVLIQLPVGTANLKENIVHNLGLIGLMSATRDLNEAWNSAKKKAAKDYPEKFVLDARGVLNWNDGSKKVMDTNISKVNVEKLNSLAEAEGCSVNKLIGVLIKAYQKNNLKNNDLNTESKDPDDE